MTKIEKLLSTRKSVFTVDDLSVLWQQPNRRKLWAVIRYYLRVGKLIKIHSGIYALGSFTPFEVAQKLITPSYISFHTALGIHGINFQLYQTIHNVALISKTITTKGQQYTYHQMKDNIFFNEIGLIKEDVYSIASPERAICDSIYLSPHITFDNLDDIDLDKLQTIASIYQRQTLLKRIKQILTKG